jgi:hypothetical protein
MKFVYSIIDVSVKNIHDLPWHHHRVCHFQLTVFLFHRKGVGDSTQTSSGFGIKDMAMDAYELLQHLGWKKDVFLAGVSMGMIAVYGLTARCSNVVCSGDRWHDITRVGTLCTTRNVCSSSFCLDTCRVCHSSGMHNPLQSSNVVHR